MRFRLARHPAHLLDGPFMGSESARNTVAKILKFRAAPQNMHDSQKNNDDDNRAQWYND